MTSRALAVMTLLLTGISSCALRPPAPSYVAQSSKSFLEARRVVFQQATTCWPRRMNPFADGISVVPNDPSPSEFEVSVYRWTWGVGMIDKPFMLIKMRQIGDGADVQVAEGDFFCSLVGTCKPLGLSKHVERWLNGDLSCPAINTSF